MARDTKGLCVLLLRWALATCCHGEWRAFHIKWLEGTIQMSESENIDVQIDRIGERIEIMEITLSVLRERIDSIAARLDVLQEEIKEN
jgi:hypothetical protein